MPCIKLRYLMHAWGGEDRKNRPWPKFLQILSSTIFFLARPLGWLENDCRAPMSILSIFFTHITLSRHKPPIIKCQRKLSMYENNDFNFLFFISPHLIYVRCCRISSLPRPNNPRLWSFGTENRDLIQLTMVLTNGK